MPKPKGKKLTLETNIQKSHMLELPETNLKITVINILKKIEDKIENFG